MAAAAAVMVEIDAVGAPPELKCCTWPKSGAVVAEPPETTDLATVPKGIKTLGKTLNEAITRCLQDDWKAKMGAACIKLAHDKFTVGAQVAKMLDDAKALPLP